MRRAAFTLVELMVVLLILALTAGAVTLRLHAQGRAANVADVVDSLKSFDHQSRQLAQRRGQGCLVTWNLAGGAIGRSDLNGKGDWGDGWQAPPGYALAELIVGSQRTDRGRMALPCTGGGQMSSYAVHVVGPKDEGTWLLVAGLSGSGVEVDNAKSAQDILALTLQGRPDAD